MKHWRAYTLLSLCALLSIGLAFTPAYADTAAELQAKIEVQNKKIAALQAEIAQYESTLVDIGKNKSTLQSEISRIDTSRKKIAASISITQDKITSANLQIQQLTGDISDKQTRIVNSSEAIGESLRNVMKISDNTFVETFFSDTDNGLIAAWQDADMLTTLQGSLRDEIIDLNTVKQELTDNRDAVAKQKSNLTSLQTQLKGQKTILDQNRQEQATLLAQTKNKESAYQALVASKKAAQKQFEAELNSYESQLQYTLDPSKIPATGQGVLQFPVDPVFMAACKNRQSIFGNIYCITQYFGNTAFAQSGAYNGSGHNGIDIGTPEGTKIIAALSGTVIGTGNTDAYPNCYSYGKWVLIKHGNGLTSLYAHLSYIGVSVGDAVPTGGLLGYSGKTGYVTGPHLHFTLYASDAVKLVKLGDVKVKTNCANATVPVSALGGYLNPISYL